MLGLPCLEVSDSLLWSGALLYAFLINYQVMLKMLVQGPPAENHWPKLLIYQHSPNQKFGQEARKQVRIEHFNA